MLLIFTLCWTLYGEAVLVNLAVEETSQNEGCANYSGLSKSKEMKMGDVLDETKGARLEAQTEKEKATEGSASYGKSNGAIALMEQEEDKKPAFLLSVMQQRYTQKKSR